MPFIKVIHTVCVFSLFFSLFSVSSVVIAFIFRTASWSTWFCGIRCVAVSIISSSFSLYAPHSQYVLKIANQIESMEKNWKSKIIAFAQKAVWISLMVCSVSHFYPPIIFAKFCVQLHKSTFDSQTKCNKYIQIKQIAHFVCRKINFFLLNSLLQLELVFSKFSAWILLFFLPIWLCFSSTFNRFTILTFQPKIETGNQIKWKSKWIYFHENCLKPKKNI